MLNYITSSTIQVISTKKRFVLINRLQLFLAPIMINDIVNSADTWYFLYISLMLQFDLLLQYVMFWYLSSLSLFKSCHLVQMYILLRIYSH